MDQLLTQPTQVIGQTVIGALLLISLYVNRFLYLEIKEMRKAYAEEERQLRAAYDGKIDKLNDARMTDMRSIDRIAESVEKLGDKVIDVAVERRRA